VVSTGGTIVAEASSTLHCSFCGKSQHEVRKLIAGPTVFICDECVGLCNGIIEDEKVFDFFAGDDEGRRWRARVASPLKNPNLRYCAARSTQNVGAWA
jgi:hypothetical protein